MARSIGPGDPEYEAAMREAKKLFEAAVAASSIKGRGRPKARAAVPTDADGGGGGAGDEAALDAGEPDAGEHDLDAAAPIGDEAVSRPDGRSKRGAPPRRRGRPKGG